MPFLGPKYAKITFAAGALPWILLGSLQTVWLDLSERDWRKGKGEEGRKWEERKGKERIGLEICTLFSNSWFTQCFYVWCATTCV